MNQFDEASSSAVIRWMFVGFFLVGCGATAPRADLHFGFGVEDRVLQPGTEEVVVAVGSRVELEVFAPRTLSGGTSWLPLADVETVRVVRTEVENPVVLRVVGTNASRVIIEGLARGSSSLSVHTPRGVDEIAVTVAEPSHVELSYRPWDAGAVEGAPTFVQGGVARFSLERQDAAGRTLSGSGELADAVRIDPPGGATIVLRHGDTERGDVRFDRLGEVTLRPLGGEPVAARVVTIDQVDSFGIGGLDAQRRLVEPARFELGENHVVVWLRDEEGERIFGLNGLTELVSATPGVCVATDVERWHADGVHQIDVLSEGACSLEAHFNELVTSIEVPAGDAPQQTDLVEEPELEPQAED